MLKLGEDMFDDTRQDHKGNEMTKVMIISPTIYIINPTTRCSEYIVYGQLLRALTAVQFRTRLCRFRFQYTAILNEWVEEVITLWSIMCDSQRDLSKEAPIQKSFTTQYSGRREAGM